MLNSQQLDGENSQKLPQKWCLKHVKTPFKTMVSCRFVLKISHWSVHWYTFEGTKLSDYMLKGSWREWCTCCCATSLLSQYLCRQLRNGGPKSKTLAQVQRLASRDHWTGSLFHLKVFDERHWLSLVWVPIAWPWPASSSAIAGIVARVEGARWYHILYVQNTTISSYRWI
jgi:hypothetical protein